MANSILSSLVSQQSFKLYSEDGYSMLDGVKVKTVSATLTARLLKNMGEDGLPIIDTKIVLPISVTVDAIADTTLAIAKINDILQDTSGRYTMYSRGLYFNGLTLASERVTLSGEMLSSNPVSLVFNGILKVGDSSVVTSQSGDSSTIIGGIVSTVSEAASEISSLASKFI